MRNANVVGIVLFIIAIIGALNWGLVGFFDYNLVDAIFGASPDTDTNWAARIVYAIVGLAGLAALFFIPSFGRSPDHRGAPAASTR